MQITPSTHATPEMLLAAIRAASTLDDLTALRLTIVTANCSGQLHDVAHEYAARRRELEGAQRAAELAAVALEERVPAPSPTAAVA